MSCREKPSISQTDFYNAVPDSLITAVKSGQLDSEFKNTISSPGDWDLNYQIVYLPPEGATVQQGEVVFDTKETELQLDQDLKQLEKLQESLKETKLNNQQTIESAQASLRTLEIQEQVVLNQMEMSKYNSDTEQKNAELSYIKELGNQHKTELIAAGLKESDLTVLDDSLANLRSADAAQESALKAQTVICAERDKLFDDLLAFKFKVCQIAAIAFRGNKAVLAEFKSIVPSSAKKKTDTTTETTTGA